MTATIAQVLETQAALYAALRGALSQRNEALGENGLRLNEWPVERAGCLYTLSVTLERAGREIGECRFTIDWRGETYFDADDQPLAPCPPVAVACGALLDAFIARRTQSAQARSAA